MGPSALRQRRDRMATVLLHVCCAPCAAACVERLRAEQFEVTLFFANANIAPPAEHARRLEAARVLAGQMDAPLLVDDVAHEEWLAAAARGLEAAPEGGERCRRCFAFNLRRTAARASALGMDFFTTSLSVSPHKDSSAVLAAGRAVDERRFLARDFKRRDGFRRSIALARSLGLYRQDYCGCEFSAGRSAAVFTRASTGSR